MPLFKNKIRQWLALADIKIDGDRPWDIRINDERFYQRVILQGSLGLGESYMDGWWDCEKLDQFFYQLLQAEIDYKTRFNLSAIGPFLWDKFLNLQKGSRAFQIGQRHYDIGNDLYLAMLDESLTYSCGYWQRSGNLEQAQKAKLDLICRKLGLRAGQQVLDIGCGWGSFARHAAKNYGVKVVGITVSQEQANLAQKLCQGLPIEIRLQDYREVKEQFDHIVSIGMFEHVGFKNYRTYMTVARRCLKEDGLFLLHTIGVNVPLKSPDPWVARYIFPNSILPSPQQISEAVEKLFVIEDWHNFGADYDPTLLAWFRNFDQAWPKLQTKYGDRFYRMWKYYLLSFAGAFRARRLPVWQIVLSKNGVPGGYQSVR